MATRLERPELLAPAGEEESLRAAVAAGADAVYFGLRGGFNARARADNFAAADLPRIFEFLHSKGVQGFVTFNTLVFDRELPVAEEALADIARRGGGDRADPGRHPGGAPARALDRGDPGDVRPHRSRAGVLRPRRALRQLERPVPDQRGAPAPQRQPGAMCAELPHALRPDRRRTGGDRARRRAAQVPALAPRPRGLRSPARAARGRRVLLQDRGPHERARVRGEC